MAIHITRVYTRSGDGGKTSLIGGERVDKDHPRLEAYGTLDELNSLVGMTRTLVPEQKTWPENEREILCRELQQMQNRIFDAGSLLAAPDADKPGSWPNRPRFDPADIENLEASMDRMQANLPDLNSFVLPGGSPVNAWLHLCRTVCRRAEREIARLTHEAEIDAGLRRYVNRLSDWFFVASRHAARLAGHGEYLWETPLKPAQPEN
jgi:cob(I)alamin adenosyltransferase